MLPPLESIERVSTAAIHTETFAYPHEVRFALEMDKDTHKASSIYHPLNPRTRQIRVLELYQGMRDEPVAGRLIVTSIPAVILIPDPTMDVAEKLSQEKARVRELLSTNSRQIRTWETSLSAEKAALIKEGQSLQANVAKQLESTPSADQTHSLQLRVQKWQAWSARLQSSQRELEKSIRHHDTIAASFSESLKTSIDPSDSAQDVHSAEETQDENEFDTRLSPDLDHAHDPMIEYEAVSYCWNDITSKSQIQLNGHSFQAPLSAVEVLQNLRLAGRTRVLWIDALCINQDDVKEREQQVAMMGNIYSSSSKALVWLGASLDDRQTQSAFELCSHVAQQILQGREVHELPETNELAAACQLVSIPNGCQPALLNAIFSCRWFTRVWVWQEVALPPTAICHIGELTIQWRDIMLTAFWWNEAIHQFEDLLPECVPDEQTQLNTHFPSTVFMMINDSHQQDQPFLSLHLSQLVYQSRHSEATNPRDKIYGLLGMSRWSRSGRSLPPGLQPRYNGSVRNCMRDATRAMLVEDRNLKVLSSELLDIIPATRSEYDTWPSWVPKWCVKDDLHGERKLESLYRADNGHKLSIEKLLNPRDYDVLVLEGYEVDRIVKTTLISEEVFADPSHLLADIQTLHTSIGGGSQCSIQTLLLTLLADENQMKRIGPNNTMIDTLIDHLALPSRSCAQIQEKQSQSPDMHGSDGKESVPLEGLDDIMSDLRQNGRGRQLFTTVHGSIGIGPNCANENDEVAVLFGSPWPFILRKQKDQHVLIGHSFVYGIMDGEAVGAKEAAGVASRTFKIR